MIWSEETDIEEVEESYAASDEANEDGQMDMVQQNVGPKGAGSGTQKRHQGVKGIQIKICNNLAKKE